MAKHSGSKRGSSNRTIIIVALIGLTGTVCAACIGLLSVLLPDLWHSLMSIFTPAVSSTPAISISNDVRDLGGNPIDMQSAPFQLEVSGTVSNADGLYVYLIVVDKNDHYVQEGLGQNVDNEFFGICQLGRIGDLDSYGQQYTIYAVVTDTPYAKFTSFKDKSYLAKSNDLKITREPMPTPTAAP